MAIRYLSASATLSTSAGSWKKCEAANLPLFPYNGAAFDDINTARTSATFTVTNGVSLQGAFLCLHKAAGTGTMTAYLMEGATQRAVSAAVTVSTLSTKLSRFWVYIPFSTPYTASSGINYSIKLTCDTAARAYWCRDNTASNWAWAVVGNGDDTTKIASGDTAIIGPGYTLTADQSLTLAPPSGSYQSMVIGEGSTFAANPSSAITLAFGSGTISPSAVCTWSIGSSGSPVGAGYVTITSTLASGGTAALINTTGIDTDSAFGIAWYGNSIGTVRLTASADAAAAQPVLTSNESVPSTWVAGDHIFLAGKLANNNTDSVDYYSIGSTTTNSITLKKSATCTIATGTPTTITQTAHVFNNGDAVIFSTTGSLPTGITGGTTYYASITNGALFNLYDTSAHAIAGGTTGRITTSGSQSGVQTVTGPGNLDVKLLLGAAICNTTEASRNAGISVLPTNLLMLLYTSYNLMDYAIFNGVYFLNMTPMAVDSTNATATGYSFQNMMLYSPAGVTSIGPNLLTSNKAGAAYSNFHLLQPPTGPQFYCNVFYGNNITADKITIKGFQPGAFPGAGNSAIFFGNNFTLNDFIIANVPQQPGYYGATFGGFGNNFSNTRFLCGQVLFYNFTGTLFNYNQRSSAYTGTVFYNSVISGSGSSFGTGTDNSSYDITYGSGALSQVTMSNSTIGSRGIAPALASDSIGSYLRFPNFAGTSGDDRTYKPNGQFATSSGSGYANLQEQTTQATAWLSHQFQLLSQTVASKRFYLIATGQVASAYYAGVHSPPKIDIYTDGNSTTPLTTLNLADSNSSAQTVAQSFTPTTSNNNVVLDFQTKTDATGSNATCTWTNCIIRSRPWLYNYTDTLVPISQCLTYPFATIPTPSTNTFITQTTQATVDAYSGISIDGSGNITLTANVTLNQVYDFVQSYCSKSANIQLAVPLTTADGHTFNCSTSLTVNGCTLSGSLGQALNLGANALTLTSGGTCTIPVTYSTSTLLSVITLSGLVTGSQYRVYDTNTSTQVANATASGSSAVISSTGVANGDTLTVDVRKPGYFDFPTQLTLANGIGSAYINQATDGTF